MKRLFSEERGQALPIFVMLIVALLGMIGLAVDAGRLYVARAELSRALDAAALAGVVELPNTSSAQTRASAYMNDNQPDATISFPAASQNQFRVKGTRKVNFLFMKVLGFKNMNISATAGAGFGTVPSDTVMLVDATGSMGDVPCNGAQNNSGCPIWEAKQAALSFNNILLGSGNAITKVGYTPFRGCHNPPNPFSACITNAQRVDLTTSKAAVQTAINNTNSIGGSGTNVCLGLYKAQEMFNGPNHQTASNTVKSLVLLSDGDNTYNVASYVQAPQHAPPDVCRPSANANSSDPNVSSGCYSAQPRERSVDIQTKALADTLRAQGIEIYIVAFGVCGTLNGTTATAAYCSQIGNTDHDDLADQRLLKCMASSKSGTNDHYYAVNTASQLPQVFQTIARAIAFRLIE